MIQTYAEKQLLKELVEFAGEFDAPRVLNIGAEKSSIVEDALSTAGIEAIVDRLDVIDCEIKHPLVRKCFRSSVEAMDDISDCSYDMAGANFVFEHVPNIQSAFSEVYRVLEFDGKCIITIPNPKAPEFIISRITPYGFHKAIRGKDHGEHTFETKYSYKSIKNLLYIAQESGFTVSKTVYSSCIETYLYRFPIVNKIAKLYDVIVNALHLKFLSGNACIVLVKK